MGYWKTQEYLDTKIFWLVTVYSVGVSRHSTLLRHGIKLGIFFIAHLNCNFQGASFELGKTLATLIPEKLQGFYVTLLYHGALFLVVLLGCIFYEY